MNDLPASSADIARLRYRCRRGMLELDALLAQFINSPKFNQLTAAQSRAFERLLEESDPQLFRWLMGREACDDAEYRELIEAIRT